MHNILSCISLFTLIVTSISASLIDLSDRARACNPHFGGEGLTSDHDGFFPHHSLNQISDHLSQV